MRHLPYSGAHLHSDDEFCDRRLSLGEPAVAEHVLRDRAMARSSRWWSVDLGATTTHRGGFRGRRFLPQRFADYAHLLWVSAARVCWRGRRCSVHLQSLHDGYFTRTQDVGGPIKRGVTILFILVSVYFIQRDQLIPEFEQVPTETGIAYSLACRTGDDPFPRAGFTDSLQIADQSGVVTIYCDYFSVQSYSSSLFVQLVELLAALSALWAQA